MKTYSLSQSAFRKFRRGLAWRMVFVNLLILGAASCAVWAQAKDNTQFSPAIGMVVIVAGGALGFFTTYRTYQRQRLIWESVRVEMGEDYIARQQLRIPEVRIHRAEIASIREVNSGLDILTADKYRSLRIPIELNPADYQEIKTAVSMWNSIQPRSPATKAKSFVAAGVFLAGFGAAFFSPFLWLTIAAGGAVVGYSVHAYWRLWRSRGVDPKFLRDYALAIGVITLLLSLRLCALSGLLESVSSGYLELLRQMR